MQIHHSFYYETVKKVIALIYLGYTFNFPFLEQGMTENFGNLYKFVFPLLLSHPTLTVIGLMAPLGFLGSAAEIQPL